MQQRQHRTPMPISVAKILFLLDAGIWLVFTVVSLSRALNGPAGTAGTPWVVVALMAAYVAALLFLGWGIGRHRLIYYLALAVIAVTVLLTVTDQFGVLDLAVLVLNLVLLGVLVATRSLYVPRKRA